MASLYLFASLLKFAISKTIFTEGFLILLKFRLIKSKDLSLFCFLKIICASFFNLNQ